MYRKIVLALDGSEGSKRAIPHAVEQAKASEGEIVVVHVDERMIAKGDMPSVNPNEELIQDEIRGQVKEIEDAGVKVSLEIIPLVLGGPGGSINEIAEKADADLIVVGTRGRSSLTGLVLGGVAHRLLHVARRPVLAVPSPK